MAYLFVCVEFIFAFVYVFRVFPFHGLYIVLVPGTPRPKQTKGDDLLQRHLKETMFGMVLG